VASSAYTRESLKLVDTLIVVDANEKKVGNVISIDNSRAVVAFKLDKLLFVLYAVGGSVPRLEGDALWFESSDCTGTPYLVDSSPLPSVFVATDGTLYVPDLNSSLEIFPKSFLSVSYIPNNCVDQTGYPIPISVRKAIPTAVNLSQMFTPPFKVQAGTENDNDDDDDGYKKKHKKDSRHGDNDD
jgi:hypothetical protein